jgi:hypothetical protein
LQVALPWLQVSVQRLQSLQESHWNET